jgi:hypothetical protein
MNILYVNQNNLIDQYYFEKEQDCYEKIKELKCRWYVIRKESEAVSNYFSNCFEWDYEKNDLKINIEKAKEVKKNEYRLMRVSLLQALDVLFMRSLELGDQNKTQEIVQLKQKLRDITSSELPDNQEELLTFYPSCIMEVVLYLR